MLIIILQIGTSLGLVTLIPMEEIQDDCTMIKVYKDSSLKGLDTIGNYLK